MTLKQIYVYFILIILISSMLSAEDLVNIDYYGIQSNDADENMINMADNLYFAQIQNMQNIKVIDYSGKIIPDTLEQNHLLLFITISKSKTSEGTWICNMLLKDDHKNISIKKEFTSFYKILTEAKKNINDLFSSYSKSTDTKQDKLEPVPSNIKNTITTDVIAGTWTGEKYIDKIIILRSGRGFVIFKNGASMKISIEINDDKTILITQVTNPNASFFPELSRKQALENADTAEPIKWILTLTDKNTLTGTKQTLISIDQVSVKTGTIQVIWKRNS